MIAYNSSWLNNLDIREKSADAFRENYLDKEEWAHINAAHPVGFYSPNFFMRVGLFILTITILLFSFGLLALLFLNSIDHIMAGLAIFFAILCYVALETMVQSKTHFQSGVDDALLWVFAVALFGGISYFTNADTLANCVIIFIVTTYCSLRFADRIMSAVWYVSLLGILFFTAVKFGPVAQYYVQFAIMGISAILYFLVVAIKRLQINQLYFNCLQMIIIAALLSFYLSGNYYVVRELSGPMFNVSPAENGPLPLGGFFWIFTCIVPIFYIARGVQKKDILFIRVGLLMIAAIIATVRYYYTIASIEMTMTTIGITLVAVSYAITRYLATPKYGFTNVETSAMGETGKLQMESLLHAQTFTNQPTSTEGTSFGGGSFGGGGGSGEF